MNVGPIGDLSGISEYIAQWLVLLSEKNVYVSLNANLILGRDKFYVKMWSIFCMFENILVIDFPFLSRSRLIVLSLEIR